MTDFSTWSRDNLVQIAREMDEQLKARQPDPEMPTLRDLMAMFALASGKAPPENAYNVADAMLKARKMYVGGL